MLNLTGLGDCGHGLNPAGIANLILGTASGRGLSAGCHNDEGLNILTSKTFKFEVCDLPNPVICREHRILDA